MTDKMFDEKGLRVGGETDPEKSRRDEDVDVEGHLKAYEPEKTREPGRAAAKDESDDGEGVRAM